MTLAPYLAFCGLCFLLALTPGPDTFLILRFSMRRVSTGIAASIGSGVGSIFWAVLVGVGLAALIEQSAEAYRILKILGGLYLIYLGIQAFRHSRGVTAGHAADISTNDSALTIALTRARFSAFGAGLLSTALNPKVGLFFLAIVPQFLPAHGDRFAITMLLGATDAVIAIVYLSALTAVAAKATAWLNRPRVTTVLERTSGGILGALGVGTVALGIAE
jgi:threonine/homoserine/homoserine lactone efflux protein